jgi:acetate kinase
MSILVFNAGSSSLKFSLFSPGELKLLGHGHIDWKTAESSIEWRPAEQPARHLALPSTQRRPAADQLALHLNAYLDELGASPVKAVGHRVVHGGSAFSGSVRLDATAKTAIAELAPLAPLHNPEALDFIAAAENAWPHAVHVAVFDTAFYSTLKPEAYLYPAPYSWYTDCGVRRYGFHGISHAYCSDRATQLLPRPTPALRLVSCHLGNGCSATATCGGAAVATTMGFTPLEGLMMGTRSGSLDPGALLHVQRHYGLDADSLDNVLNHQSGLLGLSGVSSDYRQVEAAADAGNTRAVTALQVYALRVKESVGALAAHLGGLDALLFTGGVGENSAGLRAAVCKGMGFMGVTLDLDLNRDAQADCDVAAPGSPARVLVLHTREEYTIATQTQKLL